LEISAVNDVRYFAAWNDANESISYTQMLPTSAPYLFSGGCPSVAGVDGAPSSYKSPRLALVGLRFGSGRVLLRIDMPDRERARVALYDVSGRRLRVLVDGDLARGETDVAWDGSTDAGGAVSSGIYFARLTSGNVRQTIRIPLIH
jgi:hypothetical protein